MSSLAAARADNFYYPPEYDGQKHGSINKFNGQHPLRERAKKIDQGILVIRFEMPFHIWCDCGKMIAKGVRFNAEKKAIGNYFSTKIWQFGLTAPCCQGRIEVHTDPKNTEYVIAKGGKRKEETYSAEDAGTVELASAEERERRRADPMAQLEHGLGDEVAAAAGPKRQVADLVRRSDEVHKSDYTANKALRRALRANKKEAAARRAEGAALGLPEHVRLLPRERADEEAAAAVVFRRDRVDNFEKNRGLKRQAITSASIFGGPGGGAGGSSRGGGGGKLQRRAELLAKRRKLAAQGGSVLKPVFGPST